MHATTIIGTKKTSVWRVSGSTLTGSCSGWAACPLSPLSASAKVQSGYREQIRLPGGQLLQFVLRAGRERHRPACALHGRSRFC
jgi:hypothetical protein